MLFRSLASMADARPDGSTVCLMTPEILTRMVNNGAMGPNNAKLNVTIKAPANYSPSAGPMTIQVTAGAPIQGILLYASNSGGSHVGSFVAPTGYKPLNIPACKNENPTSSLTQSGPAPKGTTANFQWTPPKDGQGPLDIKALVVTDRTNGFNTATVKLTGPGTAQDFGAAGGAAGSAGNGTGAGAGAAAGPASSASTSALSITFLAACVGGAALAMI